MTTTTTTTQATLSFKNYAPRDPILRARIVRSELVRIPSKDQDVVLAEAKRNARALPAEDAPVLVAPKRANWDLKRDLDKRLKKLARKTQKAIFELAQELGGDEEEE